MKETIAGTRRGAHPRLPPGPKGPGFFQAIRYASDPLGFLTHFQKRYGDMFTVPFLFYGEIVYLARPDLVKVLFTGSHDVVQAGAANRIVLEPPLGPNSVIVVDGEAHIRQRKILLPPFHGDRIARYEDLIREVTLEDQATWPVGKPFALRPHMLRITLALMLKAVFGVHDRERLARARHLMETLTNRVNMITILPILHRNLGRWSPWARFVQAREAFDQFIYEEIALRRADIAAGATDHDDVLSMLLQATYDDGSLMTDEQLRDEMTTILGAGHETTASALAWAMERILRTPRVLAKLRGSLAEGNDEYMAATVKEALRIRPVLISVVRKLNSPLEIGGYELPTGTFVTPAISALHHNEEIFPRPWEFRPERFLEENVDSYAWLPFGGGVRRCAGAAFAEYEMRIIIGEMVRRADLSVNPRSERVTARNITLRPSRGTRVVLNHPLRDNLGTT